MELQSVEHELRLEPTGSDPVVPWFQDGFPPGDYATELLEQEVVLRIAHRLDQSTRVGLA